MSSPASLNQDPSFLDKSSSSREETPSLLDREISPMIRRSQSAFQRELPLLIKNHQHRWVVYHGDRRVAIGTSKREMFKQCRHQDLPHGEFVVRLIEPEVLDEIEWNESRDV
jgi:hypothetical protein